jgi:hypothetical protein
MDFDLQLNRNRLPVQGRRLVLPLEYGLQGSTDQQWVFAQHARLDHIPVFIYHCIDKYRSRNARISRERRVYRIHGICLARGFDTRANPHQLRENLLACSRPVFEPWQAPHAGRKCIKRAKSLFHWESVELIDFSLDIKERRLGREHGVSAPVAAICESRSFLRPTRLAST